MLQRISTLLCLMAVSLTLTSPSPAQAGWNDRSDELPGLEGSAVATGALIMGASVVVGIIVAKSGPGTVRIDNPDDASFDASGSIERLGGLGAPIKISRRERGQDAVYGTIENSESEALTVRTSHGSTRVSSHEIARLEALSDLSRRKARTRTGAGIAYLGLAAGSIYMANQYDADLESGSRRLSMGMAAAFGGLAILNFARQSSEEREYVALSGSATDITVAPGFDFEARSPQIVLSGRF